MSRTPDIANTIMRAIATDDDNQSARLIADYKAADEATQAAIDNALISICGYSLTSLISRAIQRGHFVDEDD